MKISAQLNSSFNQHQAIVATNDAKKEIQISVKSTGFGSSINGGELLMLSIATCFCNDIYREAAKTGINVSSVEVECDSEFGAAGEPGTNFTYKANVIANAPADAIAALIAQTDKVAEIHNTLRKGINVKLVNNQ
jgi:uncharacterized OsmC-like protein